MRLVTWNIQAGKGCDGVIDLARIVAVANALADADIFCFQEVSDDFEAVDGPIDQSAELARLLPDHQPVFGPAVETIDQTGRLRRFGNMTLTRLPVRQVARHLLPWPRTGVSSAACGAWRWKPRCRPASVRSGLSTRTSSSFVGPTRSADRPVARPAAGGL